MTKHPPPAPPEQQSHKGTGDKHVPERDTAVHVDKQNRNTETQGRQGNIGQNTTNQGYQQDR